MNLCTKKSEPNAMKEEPGDSSVGPKIKVKKYKVKGKRLGLATANLMSMNENSKCTRDNRSHIQIGRNKTRHADI